MGKKPVVRALGMALEKAVYTPQEVMRLLGLYNRTQFWRAVKRAKPSPLLRFGPRCIRFTAEAVRKLADFYTVNGGTEAADMRRITDGRRTAG